jgi:hypothetical protein
MERVSISGTLLGLGCIGLVNGLPNVNYLLHWLPAIVIPAIVIQQ